MDNGCILLSRAILESDVFASQKLLKIWIWCLCKASFKEKSIPLKIGKGETIIKISRGQFIFGRFKAEEQLFIDGSTIYKSMQKLQELEMIQIKSNNQYSIITICNYDRYQSLENYKVTTNEQPSNNQVTTNEQPSNTTKNVNNVKKVKKENNYIQFIQIFNSITKRNFKGFDKVEKQFNARIKDKFTLIEFEIAITNASKDQYLIDGNYLTPEYITRADKLEKWLNFKPTNGQNKTLSIFA